MMTETSKKRLLMIFGALLCMLAMTFAMTIAARADDVSEDGEWTYTMDSSVGLTITKYNGTASDLVIPDRIDGYKVKAIGNSAFKNNANLTSVKISEEVIEIGFSAFQGCSNLANVTFPEGELKVNARAFQDCTSLTSVTIPAGLYEPAGYVPIFIDCTNLTTMIFEEGRETISRGFCNESDITSVTLPSTLKTIGVNAFNGCTKLTEIYIPDSVELIEDNAFSGCTSLAKVRFPEGGSVAVMYDAFANCTSLTSVTIPAGLYGKGSWGTGVASSPIFNGCTNLTEIILEPGRTTLGTGILNGTNIKEVTIPASVTEIGEYTFYNCKKLKGVTLPTGLKTIGDDAFKNCMLFTEIYIPDSVETIGGEAFSGCTNLESVRFPEGGSVAVGSEAFKNCTSITSITIPAGLYATNESYNYPIFNGCTKIKSATLEEGRESLKCGIVNKLNITSIELPQSLSQLGDFAFSNCTELKSITLLSNVKEIGVHAVGYGESDNLIEDFIIYGIKGSQAETYASKNNITFVEISGPTKVSMYRLYNPNSGEHLYSSSWDEVSFLTPLGWKYEGVAWVAPTTGSPVYRLYNPNSGDHHYTTYEQERDWLIGIGWQSEGIAWYSGGDIPVYRLFNPNVTMATHHYTAFTVERDWLFTIGWQDEDVAWYALSVPE